MSGDQRVEGVLDAEIEVDLGELSLRVPLRVGPGEVVALLGPNGAGKSTTLRALSGLQRLSGGRIELSGEVLDDLAAGVFVPTEDRRVGVMFQDYLLFEHMSVLDNVAFGPRCRGTGAGPATAVATQLLERVGLPDHADASPRSLSGGQAQRVALARALAVDPAMLLLDEPLAALDVTTRSEVRRDLHRHLCDFAGATVLVTHDPLDALALADRIVILERGAVTQQGPAAQVAAAPRSAYVAELFGLNLLRGVARGHTVALDPTGSADATIAEAATGEVLLVVRPSSISLHRTRPESSARNCWRCTVVGMESMGERVSVHLEGQVRLSAQVTPAAIGELGLVDGVEVWASVKATDIEVNPI